MIQLLRKKTHQSLIKGVGEYYCICENISDELPHVMSLESVSVGTEEKSGGVELPDL